MQLETADDSEDARSKIHSDPGLFLHHLGFG